MPRRIPPDADPNGAGLSFDLRPLLAGAPLAVVLGLQFLDGGWATLLAVLATVAVVLGLLWVSFTIPGRARHRSLRERHPAHDVVEVLGATDLRSTLKGAGLLAPRSLRWWHNPHLSLVLSDDGVTLWRGGRSPVRVCEVPWAGVRDVGRVSAAFSQAGPRPAAGIAIGGGRRLDLVPLRRVGGVIPGSAPATDRLVVALRAHRDASSATPSGASRRGYGRSDAHDALDLADHPPPVPDDAVTRALRAVADEARAALSGVATVSVPSPVDDREPDQLVAVEPEAAGAVRIWWVQTADELVVGVGEAAGWDLVRDESSIAVLRAVVDAVVAGRVEVGRGAGVRLYRAHLADGTVREDTGRTIVAALLGGAWRPRVRWTTATPYASGRTAAAV